MFTGGGTVVARYDYDPFGRSTTVLGTTPTDFNFTGLYRHSKSNLDLATYRAYDPDLGRWLSRDPMAERGGINLYRYVNNEPIVFVDHDGKNLVVAAIVVGVVAIVAWETYQLLHPAKKAGDAYGDYVGKCNDILRDPDNAEQHAQEAMDATRQLDDHLRQLATEAGTHAATGPLQEAIDIPHKP